MRRIFSKVSSGFTMIELLVVIAVIGILAIAVLSAINPVEQIRKGRDTERTSTATALIQALERYNTSSGCYPWDGAPCPNLGTDPTQLSPDRVQLADFGSGQLYYELLQTDELKDNFTNKTSVGNGELWLHETLSSTIKVCYEPESQAARTATGTYSTNVGAGTTPGTGCGSPYGGPTSPTACYVCLE